MSDQSSLQRLASMLLLLLLLVSGTGAVMEIIGKQDVQVGEDIVLFCKAGGEGDITWQKDGEDMDENMVTVIDEMSSKINVRNASFSHSGKYTCICDFETNHSDQIQKQVYIHEGPSFGDTRTYHEFLEGTNAVVPCLVSGKPAVDVRWLRDRQEVPTREGGHLRKMPDNTLHIENVRRDDAGTYVCEGQIRKRPVTQSLAVSVVVNVSPKVYLKEEVKKVMAGSETNVSLFCLVDGQPKPNITWSMPTPFNPSRHRFNSDSSELTISSVARVDYGEYVCTASNRISEDSATLMLHVFEAPEVFVSAEQQSVKVGERVSVSCNVSGHPQPGLHWLNKHSVHTLASSSGRIQVVDGVLTIDDMMPSDGGLYSCMAVSASGNASRDVAIFTQPGPPHYLSVSPGPTSVIFSLKTLPVSGGTPITSYVLQWRMTPAEQWKEVTVPAPDLLAITGLKPYTQYSVRIAAMNKVGVGKFSDTSSVRTMGIREPDSPVLSSNEVKVKGNTFSAPLKQSDDGGLVLLNFVIRYKEDKEGSQWKEMKLPADAKNVTLKDLSFGSDYQLEVRAVNANGSSLPGTLNFTIAEKPPSRTMTKGTVVGIVMVIFLLVFLVVDATCCYKNRCGLLMSIAVKIFGQRVPGLKMLEEGSTNGDVKLKGISTPRGSIQQVGVQTLTKEGGQITEVTCDKAPLTKHEKTQPDRSKSAADA